MLKARSKKVSLLLVFMMLATLFVGVGVAGATDMYSVGSVPAIEGGEDNQKLGSLIVTAYNFEPNVVEGVYQPDAGFIVKLPADFVITKVGSNASFNSKLTFNPGAPNPNAVATIIPFKEKGDAEAVVNVFATGQENRVKVIAKNKTNVTIEELKFSIPMEVTTPKTVPDEVKAMIAKEPGSVFSDNLGIVVATAAKGSVQAIANDPINVQSSGNTAKFSVRSNTEDALTELKVDLPAGFYWTGTPKLTKGAATINGVKGEGESKTVTFNVDKVTPADAAIKGIWSFEGDFDVDESRAKFGDVVLTLSKSGVTPSKITIGTYADFGVEVSTSEVPTVLAGRSEVEVADIIIKETAAGSLVNGRAVYLTLPDGARWLAVDADKDDYNLVREDIDETGSVKFKDGKITVYSNKDNMAKFTVSNDFDALKKGSLTIEAPQIEIAPDFVGDINVKITGSAGVEKEIKVAEVIAPVTVKADATDVKIGLQEQAGGNIVITEAEAEALQSSPKVDGVNEDGYLTLRAPVAVQWAKVPTVKVVEGDLEIGTVTRDVTNRTLSIRIKEDSTTTSKIEISNVVWTVDRTVPEGDMKVSVAGSAVVQAIFTNRTTVTSFVAAKVVTPAPDEVAKVAVFKFGEAKYTLNGVEVAMDAAPYAKNNRTYAPIRYVANALGVSDQNIIWDQANKTVTLMKGDKVVQLKLGSSIMLVNGAPIQMDVVVEAQNNRTFLPAAWVAQAFGGKAVWDAAANTVTISY